MQITEIGLGNSSTDASLLKLEYGYGTNQQNNGSLRSQKISFNGLAQPFEQTYAYDDLNRLLSAEEKVNNATTWKQTFQYDRYGNRRFDAANTTTLTQSNNLTNPQIDTTTNRFSAGQNYTYDKTGNLTQDASGNQFLYDGENHQKEVKDAQNQTVAIYLYDGEGRRIKKVLPNSGEETIFVYNAGGQLAAEYVINSESQIESPSTNYLTADHLGSPRIITDENGSVTSRKDYMAFGEETSTSQRTATLGYQPTNEVRQGYTGYEQDTESGLDFAQARYYNSAHGRFTSVDPLTASANVKNPQTFNRYSYVLNSPYKFTDPLGLISSSTGANGGTPYKTSGSNLIDRVLGGFSDNLKRDLQLLQWHVANGTALGYTWQNALAKQQNSSSSPPTNAQTGNGSSAEGTPVQTAQNIQNSENGSTEVSETNNETGDLILHITIDIDSGTLEISGFIEGAPVVVKSLFSTKIGSGSGDCNNKTSCEAKKNQGPTPRGNYTINVDELSEPTVVGTFIRKAVTGDWGSFRIPLRPNKGTDTLGRDGFYIHGGDGKGTAGCVDIGGGRYGDENTRKFTGLLRSSKYANQ